MPLLFNDLLSRAGIPIADVRLLRHQTDPGKDGRTLYDLWRQDRPGFELYQREQEAGRKILRTGRYWASFACPGPDSTLFLGLYEARFLNTMRPEWECPYRGGLINNGDPVDLYDVTLSNKLTGHIGRLTIDWPRENVRTWVRYASGAPFPVAAPAVPASTSPLGREALEDAHPGRISRTTFDAEACPVPEGSPFTIRQARD